MINEKTPLDHTFKAADDMTAAHANDCDPGGRITEIILS